jgi:hypothetical protein
MATQSELSEAAVIELPEAEMPPLADAVPVAAVSESPPRV